MIFGNSEGTLFSRHIFDPFTGWTFDSESGYRWLDCEKYPPRGEGKYPVRVKTAEGKEIGAMAFYMRGEWRMMVFTLVQSRHTGKWLTTEGSSTFKVKPIRWLDTSCRFLFNWRAVIGGGVNFDENDYKFFPSS